MKGVEAPFQLMVSVIGLVAVLALAYLVLSNASEKDCINHWENQLRSIASVLSVVSEGSAPTKMSVKFDFRCGSATFYTLSLVSESNPNTCLRVCGTAGKKGCTFLKLEASKITSKGKDTVATVTACAEGVSTYIKWGEGLYCKEGENVTKDLREGMELNPPFGVFLIEKRLTSGEPVVICRVG